MSSLKKRLCDQTNNKLNYQTTLFYFLYHPHLFMLRDIFLLGIMLRCTRKLLENFAVRRWGWETKSSRKNTRILNMLGAAALTFALSAGFSAQPGLPPRAAQAAAPAAAPIAPAEPGAPRRLASPWWICADGPSPPGGARASPRFRRLCFVF